MEKRLFFPLLLLVAGPVWESSNQFVCQAAAQSAAGIIGRHKKASGDSAAARIKSTLMSGTVRMPEGATGAFSYETENPDRIRIDIEAGGRRVSECYNGKSAWIQDQRGLRTLLGSEAKSLRLVAILANSRLRDLSRYRISAQQPGKGNVDGHEANSLEFILGDARVKVFLDSASNLVVKQERETAEGLQEIFYSDYRKVDGVMEPFSIRINQPAGG